MRHVAVGIVGLCLFGALAGCSGAGKFARDTIQLPGKNPNAVKGSSETLALVRGQGVTAPALMPEPGNVWPGPPKPFPTLQDVAARPDAGGGYNPLLGGVGPNGSGGGSGGRDSGSGGDGLQSGQSMSLGGNAGDFSGAGDAGGTSDATTSPGLPLPPIVQVPRPALPTSGTQAGKVVIPNGDGTQTVISPDGSVATVPSPK